jgi:hypothetical protein
MFPLTPRRTGRSFQVWLKTCAARTLLLAMVTFATLFFSGCGDSIYSVPPQNTLAKPNARDQGDHYPSGFVDWTKPATDQPGETYPTVLEHLDATTTPIRRRLYFPGWKNIDSRFPRFHIFSTVWWKVPAGSWVTYWEQFPK